MSKPTTFDEAGIEIPFGAYGRVRTVCPQCSPGRNKSREKCLTVDVDNGKWICNHCSWSGALDRGTNPNAYGAPAPRQRAYTKPEYRPVAEYRLPDKPLAYLTLERRIPARVLDRNRIEVREVYFPQTNGQQTAVAFPYFRGDEVVNVKYRSGKKHFRMEKDAELLLYGEGDIQAGHPLVWVEGEIDKLSVEAAGIKRCVSVPNGAPPPGTRGYAKQFDYLDGVATILEHIPKHVIAVDNDTPGVTLRQELTRRLGPAKCYFVEWPEGCKDANDVLVRHDEETLLACIRDAKPAPVEGLFEVGDLHDEIVALYERGLPGGLHPGNDRLAERYRVRPGLWTVVTGIPSHGKSSFLDWLLVNMMEHHGWRVAICSPENQPLARHAANLMQIRAGVPFGEHPDIQRMTPFERDAATEWLNEHVTFVLPPEDSERAYALESILELCRVAILRHGVSGIVIDPWNELEHSRPPGVREDEHISRSITILRRFARAHGVHIWLVAHPRLLKKKDERNGEGSAEYEVPTPYDISGGAQWRNKADMALTIYRHTEGDDLPVEIHVQKVRFREDGKLGKVLLHFDEVTGRYYSRAEDREYGPALEQGFLTVPVLDAEVPVQDLRRDEGGDLLEAIAEVEGEIVRDREAIEAEVVEVSPKLVQANGGIPLCEKNGGGVPCFFCEQPIGYARKGAPRVCPNCTDRVVGDDMVTLAKASV